MMMTKLINFKHVFQIVNMEQLCKQNRYNNQDYQKLCDNHKKFMKSLRIDSGVQEGSAISIHYDPLMCKVITHGHDRMDAIVQMRTALDMLVIRGDVSVQITSKSYFLRFYRILKANFCIVSGVASNIPLLSSILNEPKFVSGLTHTNFLHATFGNQFLPKPLQSLNLYKLCSLVASIYEQKRLRNTSANTCSNILTSKTSSRILIVTYAQHTYELDIQILDEHFDIRFCSENVRIKLLKSQVDLAASLLAISFVCIDGIEESNQEQLQLQFQADLIQLLESDAVGNVRLQFQGCVHIFHVCTAFTHQMLKHMREIPNNEHIKCIRSPMPGMIRSLCCKPNDLVIWFERQFVVFLSKLKLNCASPLRYKKDKKFVWWKQ